MRHRIALSGLSRIESPVFLQAKAQIFIEDSAKIHADAMTQALARKKKHVTSTTHKLLKAHAASGLPFVVLLAMIQIHNHGSSRG
jgi:hypothetical protein